MQVNEIISLAREYIDEPVEADWSDSDLLSYVNVEHSHLFSLVRRMYEDWFGRESVFITKPDSVTYFLPIDCVTVRRVELIKSAAVSGSAPFLTVNEELASPEEVFPTLLNGNTEGYFLWNEQLRFTLQYLSDDGRYIRLFYIPTAPELHRATALGGSATSITLGNSVASTTLGKIRTINNYYTGMRIELISGTGAGQIGRVTAYNGATKVATIEGGWSTPPDTTTVYSIVSPIVADFHELLALGGAMRAKGLKTEDDTTEIGQTYGALIEDLKNSLETRVQQRSRHTNTRNPLGRRAYVVT